MVRSCSGRGETPRNNHDSEQVWRGFLAGGIGCWRVPDAAEGEPAASLVLAGRRCGCGHCDAKFLVAVAASVSFSGVDAQHSHAWARHCAGAAAVSRAQAEMLGYVAAILVVAALLFFFTKQGRTYRALGWAYVVFLAVIMVMHGKMYYVAPVYPMLFAAGAVWVESETKGKLWVWVKPALAVAIAAMAGIYAPTILPVLSVPNFLAYEHMTGLEPQKFEHQPEGVLPQIYADMFGWEEVAQQVGAYYKTLSPEEQRKTAIFANNYGDGGAIDFFGPRYGLPKAIGNHQNYWIWGPREYTGESIIVLGEGHERNMQEHCKSYSIIEQYVRN